MADNTSLVIKINGDIKGYEDALKDVKNETQALQGQLNTIAKAGAVAFAGFGAAILYAASQAAKFETIETQFATLTGSVETAKTAIKDLSDFSAKTPFQFEQVANAGKQLISFGVTVENLKPTLKGIGDVAAATGAEFSDMTLIFGQVKAAGKLTGERLLQLQERAVPIGPALAETMGVAESAIKDMVSKGLVSFNTFEKAFQSLSEEGGIAFEGMSKRSETFEGQISTLKDNFQLVTAAIGQEFLPVLKELAGAFTNILQYIQDHPGLTKFIRKLLIAGTAIGGIITVGALAATMFLSLRSSMIAAAIATRGLSFAVKGLIGATGIGLLIAFLPEILSLFQQVFPYALQIAQQFGTKMGFIFGAIGAIFSDVLGIIKGFFTGFWSLAKSAISGVAGIFGGLSATLSNVLGVFKDVFAGAINIIKNAGGTISDLAGNIGRILRGLFTFDFTAIKEGLSGFQQTISKSIDIADQKVGEGADNIKSKVKEAGSAFLDTIDEMSDGEVSLSTAKLSKDIKTLKKGIGDFGKWEIKEIKKTEQKVVDIKEESADDQEELEEEKTHAVDTELEKRKQLYANEIELTQAKIDKLTKEEIDFIKTRQELKKESIDAQIIQDQDEKQFALDAIANKHALLLQKEELYYIKKAEIAIDQSEKQRILDRNLDALSKEQRALLSAEDQEGLRKHVKTEAEILSEFAAEKVRIEQKNREQFIKDEQEFGTIMAKIKQAGRSEEMNQMGVFAGMIDSENDNLKNIAKAAAIAQITISTVESAMKAFNAFAWIPYVGWGLGIAAGAVVTAYGMEQIGKVQRAQDGGLVNGTGSGDKMPFLLEPGELITPKRNFDEVINAVANQRAGMQQPSGGGEVTAKVEIGFKGDEATDVLTVKQNEQKYLGISQEATA